MECVFFLAMTKNDEEILLLVAMTKNVCFFGFPVTNGQRAFVQNDQ